MDGLIAVQSSNVDAVGYDADERLLSVRFKGGQVYQYADVPPEVNEALMQAKSVGSFIAHNVVGKYASAKVPKA